MSSLKPSLGKRFIVEILGTFILVFMGTFAVTTGQNVLSIGLAFAAAAMGAIYAFGHISGAHLNPAVTFSLAVRGRFPWKEVAPYGLAQITGSVLAALINASIIGEARMRTTSLGATYPSVSFGLPGIIPYSAALIAEIVTTFILVLTILSATEKESPAGFAGIAIGLVLGINVMLTANISGGSMNPARSFGPALVQVLLRIPFQQAFQFHWIYWLGPLLGGFLAVLAHWVKS
jgi:MIP family channel proteins